MKLAVREPESAALRRYLRRRQPIVSSALARTEVARALLPLGPAAVERGRDVLVRVQPARVSDLHLAIARQLGADLARIITHDERMATAAAALGWTVGDPA